MHMDIHAHAHAHAHAYAHTIQAGHANAHVRSPHPSTRDAGPPGRIMFGISSLFSDQQHPTYPARFSFFRISPPARCAAWRLARGEY